MYPILDARPLAPDVSLVRIRAPRIARKRRAGQFVMLRVHDHGERIPLTIADSDPERGCITLVVQGVGKTTRLLNGLVAGDCVLDVVGPLPTLGGRSLRHGVRGRGRRRRRDRVPDRRRPEAGRQPGRLDPRRAAGRAPAAR